MGFFDELSKKATQTYKNTAEKTNKLSREMRLKSLINDEKSMIEKIYVEIGKKVYEKHIREENIDIKSELLDECSKIDAYAKEIEDMRVELLALKGIKICTECAAEIPVNARFCPKCGSKQEVVSNETTQESEINNNEVNNANVNDVQANETNNVEQINTEPNFDEVNEVEKNNEEVVNFTENNQNETVNSENTNNNEVNQVENNQTIENTNAFVLPETQKQPVAEVSFQPMNNYNQENNNQ